VIPHLKTEERIIDDVTKLNPVLVDNVIRPKSIEELCELVKSTKGPISIGGGRFSMGGQTASPHTTHIDMRGLNQVIAFSEEEKLIKVQAGIRWCDIQRYIDPYDLSIKIMQTYANFTVGGALSVNAHGRYMGSGPVVLSVRSIDVVLADGSSVHASLTENRELFFGAIGGYNALGIIAQAELELADNVAVKRVYQKMKVEDYKQYFFDHIRNNPKAVFHNGDIYPPQYKRVRAVTWEETDEKPTVKTRLMPLKESYPVERYFLWAFTERPLGKPYREFVIDPLLYRGKKIHWRNYEAGYDVAELEPKTRTNSTYVLLEYFVPVQRFEDFETDMAEIFIRHNVNVLNVSIRHAKADPGTYLAWAREEVFAFVVYYKQRTDAASKNKVAVWTRELADAVIAVNGTYYLPYQVHPTAEQFHKAYPNAHKLFELKAKLDPDYKFRNVLWDTYYQPTLKETYA
jgi:FAD/FMN-containing dehydrogenase